MVPHADDPASFDCARVSPFGAGPIVGASVDGASIDAASSGSFARRSLASDFLLASVATALRGSLPDATSRNAAATSSGWLSLSYVQVTSFTSPSNVFATLLCPGTGFVAGRAA